MSSPAIVQIVPSLNTGGAERTTIDVAEALHAAGFKALVASEGGRMETELTAKGGELIRLTLNVKAPHKLIANARRLQKLIVERDVKIVHARSRAPAWSALWAARIAHVPFVTTYHGIYNASNPLKRFYNSVMKR
ncbi:MAG TPA: glycosyltransferase, partial [Rhizomicrobium sp.]|nr:glycosyltransferase [Rhizomicrobium sp.]